MIVRIDPENWLRVETLVERLETRRQRGANLAEAPVSDAVFVDTVALQEALGITPEDIHILLLALAPVVRPRVGWLYREHQPGVELGAPGIDLIGELLALDPGQVVVYRNRLAAGAPLIARGLVERDQQLPYAPIVPTPRSLRHLFGLRPVGAEIPGAILMGGAGGEPSAALDRLICAPHLRRQLEEIACWPGYDEQLVRWGVPVEHGPVVLFTGASGTGKTLAARALADRADLPLYRVDMGLLVSKYIGDTPKNINRLFRHARRTEAVLLFDEAEGLFGKRGAVKEARDRYANMEVGHLLARMEQHPGICLLTTNLRNQIDPAFLRRIDVVLQFNLPSEAERRRLWQLYLGEMAAALGRVRRTGLHPVPHPEELAQQLSTVPRLSGAQIANACRHAARHFAHQLDRRGDGALNHEAFFLHGVARGLWNELKKTEGGAVRASLGCLEPHLEAPQQRGGLQGTGSSSAYGPRAPAPGEDRRAGGAVAVADSRGRP